MSAKNKTTPIALTIAGSDSSGGAGIQADLKTFTALGVYGASVLTAITAQNTLGVDAVQQLDPDIVAAQFHSVQSDLSPSAVKTGMLGSAPVVITVTQALKELQSECGNKIPLIVDPVMIATSGDRLADENAIDAVRTQLVPFAMLITPNLAEAAVLLGCEVAQSLSDMEEQARALLKLGSQAVLVKGGHYSNSGLAGEAVDVLADDQGLTRLANPWVDTTNTHGTGCTLSAAIAANMALGFALREAVSRAKIFVWEALEHGRAVPVGRGNGPVDHLHGIRKL